MRLVPTIAEQLRASFLTREDVELAVLFGSGARGHCTRGATSTSRCDGERTSGRIATHFSPPLLRTKPVTAGDANEAHPPLVLIAALDDLTS